MIRKKHWQSVYQEKSTDKVSWYRPHLEISLEFIRSSNLPRSARIVDAGGGASTLVDDLLANGYYKLAVIDLAEAALQVTRDRLGGLAHSVEWIAGDVTTPLLADASVDLWHDRAVFHFLAEDRTRTAYVDQITRCIKPGGKLLIATFGLDGPETCSGLPVVRYDAHGIQALLGASFLKLGEASERHETPWGSRQSFVYFFYQRAT